MSERLRYIDAIDHLIRDLKAEGIWDTIGAMCLLVGGDFENCFVPIKRGTSAPTNVEFDSGDHNRKTGLVGDADTKYIDSGRNNNADGQNDQAMGVWVSSITASGTAYIGTGVNTSGTTGIVRRSSPDNMVFRSRAAGFNDIVSAGSSTGLVALSRTASTGYTARVGGASSSMTRTSEEPMAGNVFVFGRNAEIENRALSAARLAVYFIGPAITLATMDTILTNFMAKVAAA